MSADDINADLDEAAAAALLDRRHSCPVTVIGMGRGRVIYMVTESGNFHDLATDRMTTNTLIGLFEGDIGWCEGNFPRTAKDGDTLGVNWSDVVAFLAQWGRDIGIINPERVIRGPGYWPGDEVEFAAPLVVHCGDQVLHNGVWRRPGLIARKVYLASWPFQGPAEAGPPPAAPGWRERPYHGQAVSVEDMSRLRGFFGRWNWRDPMSPTLLVGWIAAAYLPGVLDWRPHLWISGDRSSGKSTLQRTITAILGDALLSLADTTEAGVRQQLMGGARPVAIDEIEPDDQSDRASAVVKLARLASQRGGGRVARGGADGTGTITSVDAVFLFSSILRPPLSPQDLQRITVLDLGPAPADPQARADLVTEAKAMARLGPGIQARLVEQWPRFDDTLEAFRAEFARQGHATRAADQLGTLVALADLLLNNHLPDADSLSAMVDAFNVDDLADRLDDSPDHERCIAHLLSSLPPVRGFGTQKTIGNAITEYLNNTTDEGVLAEIRQSGLSVIWQGPEMFLAVANTHQGIAGIFKDTHWRARSGATGAWVQALRRIEGAQAHRIPVRFAGNRCRATVIPIASLADHLDGAARESVTDVNGGVNAGVNGQGVENPEF